MSPKLLTPERRAMFGQLADLEEQAAVDAEAGGRPEAAAEHMALAMALRNDVIVLGVERALGLWAQGQAKTPAPAVEEDRETARVSTLVCPRCGQERGE